MQKQIDFLLWDWNGTLLDDVDTGVRVINKMLQKRGLPELADRNEYRNIFRFPVKDYYLDLGFDFGKESFENLSVEYVKLYEAQKKWLFPDTVHTLQAVKQLDIAQLILSASENGLLMQYILNFNLKAFFNDFLTLDNIYASGKTEVAEAWLKRNNISPQRILIAGDTMHDYEVAHTLGCKCVLIDRGHQTLDKARNLDIPVANSLTQVLNYL